MLTVLRRKPNARIDAVVKHIEGGAAVQAWHEIEDNTILRANVRVHCAWRDTRLEWSTWCNGNVSESPPSTEEGSEQDKKRKRTPDDNLPHHHAHPDGGQQDNQPQMPAIPGQQHQQQIQALLRWAGGFHTDKRRARPSSYVHCVASDDGQIQPNKVVSRESWLAWADSL